MRELELIVKEPLLLLCYLSSCYTSSERLRIFYFYTVNSCHCLYETYFSQPFIITYNIYARGLLGDGISSEIIKRYIKEQGSEQEKAKVQQLRLFPF